MLRTGNVEDPDAQIAVQRRGATATVRVGGALDLVSAPGLREAVDGLRGQGVRHLVVDLRELSFLGASGLHVFVELDQDARRDGHDVTFVRPAEPLCREPFALLGLDERLAFVEDPDELLPPA